MMITTVTLNPAVDKTYTATGLILGQVNRMQSVQNIAGGKGINVAKILRQYGHPVTAMGFLGGYTGSFIETYMKEIQAASAFTKIREETRSSINIVAEDGYVTEILEPGPEISAAELECFMTDYRQALGDSELVTLSGSVPRGVPENIYQILIQSAREQGKRVILDTSGAYLAAGIKGQPFMIKPNLKELEFLAGHRINGVDEAALVAQRLIRGGITHVMVSLGKKGLIYAAEGMERVLYAKSPEIKPKNTIGCGDSVVASFVMSLMEHEDADQILKKAVAISAANATTLEIGMIPIEEAEQLYGRIEIKYL